ncbi:2-octaprenyl-6-methoxyphenyl hydroxylase [Zooshikella marina]|uniref:2-octaprenyl-6-methoxyphenyl hydroxylase n=1 Tax=Zooshikella ganghwensis TaxID=202772 RepID=UPI001BAFDEAB|nr:2-octaprenyl-6-methoxyphenyl hydroxylase [Zooshikella ganghwensis]MBU2708235.1 2-octaprenyl-6-methoxyphenyl hydroxylase [Zooshikella ganghwensis]
MHFPVVIIGGGMVGATLAHTLSRLLPQKTALIEASPFPAASQVDLQPSFDARSTALAWGTRLLFEQLGLWDELNSQATPIEHIHVSNQGHFGFTRLHAQDEGVSALGYVISNQHLGQTLFKHLLIAEEKQTLELIMPGKVVALNPNNQGTSILLERNDKTETVTADLVIIADGGRSGLTEQLGIDITEKHYNQSALIANVALSKSHQNIAYERFTESGPMALLPLSGKHCALVWSLPEAMVDDVALMSEADFASHLQQNFGYRLGRFAKIGLRHIYPLTLRCSTEQVRPGLVVLGNAAHQLHPVAGQGFNLALRDALRLAEVIKEALMRGEPLYSLKTLNHYVQRQEADQQLTIQWSDRLVRWFSATTPSISILRNLGLIGLDLCFPGKSFFTQHAMGMGLPAAKIN